MSFALLLEKARHELIDTTLRNPLIKYRWDKTSRGVKRSEKDNSVLTTLETDLLQGNAIGFSAVSDARLDKRKSLVQTDLSAEGLQKRLTKLYREARSFQQEQGFGVLYIAIGFLEWYEDEQSDLPALAPLLLIPIELKRDNDSLFSATYTQEEIQPNVSLIRKVNDDFGIRWPDWLADGQDDARAEHSVPISARLSRPSVASPNAHAGLYTQTAYAGPVLVRQTGYVRRPEPGPAQRKGRADSQYTPNGKRLFPGRCQRRFAG